MDFNADHFALLGLPRTFRIDVNLLDERYRAVQAQVHPDRFADADETQRRRSLQWATKVNEAYVALRKPLARALYLLKLVGFGIDLADNHAMPVEFLMEQMEWREAVAEAREHGGRPGRSMKPGSVTAGAPKLNGTRGVPRPGMPAA